MPAFTIRQWPCTLLAICLLGLTTPLAAQDPEPPGLGERIGKSVDAGLDRLGVEIREGWASLRQTVDRMGIQGRVYGRLRWDKQLADAELEVYTQDADTVLLRGTVASAAAKEKAIELAGDTIGVTRVTDELKIEPPVAPTPTER